MVGLGGWLQACSWLRGARWRLLRPGAAVGSWAHARSVALAQAAREAALHAIALPLASGGLGSGSGSGDAEIEHAVAETSEH